MELQSTLNVTTKHDKSNYKRLNVTTKHVKSNYKIR